MGFFAREERRIHGAFGPREVEPESERYEPERNSRRSEEEVEGDDVHDHGREERERERHGATREQERTRNHLGYLDERKHVTGGCECTTKCRRFGGGRWLGDEMQKAV